jgi:hypothetical protein
VELETAFILLLGVSIYPNLCVQQKTTTFQNKPGDIHFPQEPASYSSAPPKEVMPVAGLACLPQDDLGVE